MNAVVVLTRGYANKSGYSQLIARNRALEAHYDGELSYVICHEGNIPEEHQVYIQRHTKLPLHFTNVSRAFRKTEMAFYPPSAVSRSGCYFGLGYRNMCNFWFCGFWRFLGQYDKILRIDEDCVYSSDYRKIFDMLDRKVAAYGKWAGDAPTVTRGLQNFTKGFMKHHGRKTLDHDVGGPYTNVIGLNLREMRKNTLLGGYVRAVKDSGYIYQYRWGDLPLWGEALLYCFEEGQRLESRDIHYYHGSHKSTVNG